MKVVDKDVPTLADMLAISPESWANASDICEDGKLRIESNDLLLCNSLMSIADPTALAFVEADFSCGVNRGMGEASTCKDVNTTLGEA